MIMMQIVRAFTFLTFVDYCLAQGTELGGGIITRTDVQEYADLALDIRDISQYVQQNKPSQVLQLYQQGHYAEYQPGSAWPIQKLSADLAENQKHTPLFLFQTYGLSALNASNLNQYDNYVDSFILGTINDNFQYTTDAILSIAIWMYASHLLFNGLSICEYRTFADNQDLFQLGGGGMDEFIALWIGTDQASASSSGHSLYAWAQTSGDLFGTTSPEADVNKKLKLSYQEGAAALSISNPCSPINKDTYKTLWNVVAQMVPLMAVPLFQWLFYHIIQKNADAVRVYATALIPQVAKCRPSLFKRLQTELLGTAVDFSKSDSIIKNLQDAYSCFGLTCKDIGVYNGDARLKCDEFTIVQPLAGYQPTFDVTGLARLDLDVYQIRILTQLENENTETFSKLMYTLGFNAPMPRDSDSDPLTLFSLHALGTTNDRKDADPIYTQYVDYFNDMNYADKAVTAAFKGSSSKWNSEAQNTEVVSLTSALQIVYMQAIARLQRAVYMCKEADPNNFAGFGSDPIDEAAALIIGSMEGPSLGGSADVDDGQFIYGLANKRAFQFTTINAYGYANVNSDLEDYLYGAKGEFDALDCLSLSRTTTRIEKLMNVALIQSTLYAAVQAQNLPASSRSPILAEGEVYALSVLPIIAQYDSAAANLIHQNMVWTSSAQPVHDGAQNVAEAFGNAFVYGIQLPCGYLGGIQGAQPCDNLSPSASSVASNLLSAALGLSILLYLL